MSDKVTCKICDKKVIASSISSHTRLVHCITLREYELIYVDIYHQFNICGERIINTPFNISKHLRREYHGLTFPEYSEKFVKDWKNSFNEKKQLATSIQDPSREEIEKLR